MKRWCLDGRCQNFRTSSLRFLPIEPMKCVAMVFARMAAESSCLRYFFWRCQITQEHFTVAILKGSLRRSRLSGQASYSEKWGSKPDRRESGVAYLHNGWLRNVLETVRPLDKELWSSAVAPHSSKTLECGKILQQHASWSQQSTVRGSINSAVPPLTPGGWHLDPLMSLTMAVPRQGTGKTTNSTSLPALVPCASNDSFLR